MAAGQVVSCGITSPSKMAALGSGSIHAEAEEGSETTRECFQVVVKDSEVVMMEQADGSGTPGHVLTQTVSEEVIRTIAESNPVYYLQPDGSLLPGEELARPTVSWRHGESQEGHVVVSVPPDPPSVVKNAAQQLPTVAQHVALRQGTASPAKQKDLKSIRVEVPGLQAKKEKIQIVGPLQLVQKSDVHGKMDTGPPSLLGAQVIHIKPQSEHEREQLLLQTSDKTSTMQLVQKSLPAEKSKNDGSKTQALIPGETANKRSAWTAQTRLLTGSVPRASKKSSDKEHKGKKSLKVKTRSGRISRPPKHKAKDYKFIKLGDLALNHNSDSDDYSELNTEDEEDLARDHASRDFRSNPVKHTLFQCETCEKSYMGKGGLSRHYRLHPTHGQMQSLSSAETPKASDAHGSPRVLQPLPSEQQVATLEAGKSSNEDSQQDPNTSSAPSLAPAKQETKHDHRGPNRSRRPKTIGRRSVGRFRRPRKILRTDSPAQDALNKLKLKELLQQCENTDLKEMLLPYVTNLFTVYEFLLLKVEYDHPKDPHFPSVYKEFECLHSEIKALAQDYFSNTDQTVEKTVDIKDQRVAESLGILFEDSAVGSMSPTSNQQANSDIMHSEEELQEPPAKRQKNDIAVSDGTDQTSHNEATSVKTEEKQNDRKRGIEHRLPEDGSYLMTTSNNRIVLITQTISHSEQTEDFAEVLIENNSDQTHYQVTALSEVAESQPCTDPSASSSNSHRDPDEPVAVAGNFDGRFALDNIKMATVCQEEARGVLFPCQTQPSAFEQASSEHTKPELSYPGAGHCNVVESHGTDPGCEPEKSFTANVSSDHTYMTYTDTLEIPLSQGTTVLLGTSPLDGNCVMENHHQATLCDVNRDQFVIIQNVEEIADGAGTLLVKNDATALHLETMETYFQMETN